MMKAVQRQGPLPNQLSASWPIPYDATVVGLYQKMAAGGQSFLWAVGDNNTTCPTPICPYGLDCGQDVRATMLDVTSVGGTILTMSGNGAAWSKETGATDGGGLLASFPIPSYQKGIPTSVSNPNNRQMAPDVAAMKARRRSRWLAGPLSRPQSIPCLASADALGADCSLLVEIE